MKITFMTLQKASIRRMLRWPEGWVMLEVPILITMRIAASFFLWFTCVS